MNQTYWGSIRVQKYTVSPSDPDHVQTPEAGATFRVYPSSYSSYENALASDPKAVDTCDIFTTDANGLGQTTHQLPYGTYTVEQIDNTATTNTFRVDPWQVTIGAIQNGVYTYVRENPLYEQFLRILKTDADTGEAIPIAGAAFEILDASGNVLKDRSGNSTFYTDSTGAVNLSSLPLLVGIYGIRETAAPTGYSPSSEIFRFTVAKTDHGTGIVTVEAGKDIRTVSIENRKISGRLNIYKLASDTDLPMAGVVFEIFDQKGTLVDTITTDKDGKASTKILPYGSYYMNETKTNTGYILGATTSFSIFRQPMPGELYSDTDLTLYNDKMATISVAKATKDDNIPMDGVVFGIYDDETGKEIARMTTDKAGKASVYVTPGSYYLQEISTWPGYSLAPDKIEIRNAQLAQVYHFSVNNKPTGVLSKKESPSGEPLSGTEFKVTDLAGNVIKMYWDEVKGAYIALDSPKIQTPTGATTVDRVVSGKDGSLLILGLIADKQYVITETKAPTGYNNDSKPVTITVPKTSDILGTARFVDTLIAVAPAAPVKTGETEDTMKIAAAIGLLAAGGMLTGCLVIFRHERRKKEGGCTRTKKRRRSEKSA